MPRSTLAVSTTSKSKVFIRGFAHVFCWPRYSGHVSRGKRRPDAADVWLPQAARPRQNTTALGPSNRRMVTFSSRRIASSDRARRYVAFGLGVQLTGLFLIVAESKRNDSSLAGQKAL